jgi:hypothetical protein
MTTAHRVVESNSFRGSSPTLFNDPFDHQIGFVFRDSQDLLAKHLLESMLRIVYEEAVPRPAQSSPLLSMALLLRANRARIPRLELKKQLEAGCIEVARGLQTNLAKLNAALRDQLCQSRVFCVSESPDNVVMWSHYGDEHRGVVFQLDCIDELDNRLLAARKVEYSDQFLTYPSARTYAQHLTGESPFDMTPLVWDIAYTKHKDWSYEREWRVHMPLQGGEGFSTFDEPQEVFGAAILGCRVTDAQVEEFRALASKHLPKMKILRARISSQEFKLHVEPVDAA